MNRLQKLVLVLLSAVMLGGVASQTALAQETIGRIKVIKDGGGSIHRGAERLIARQDMAIAPNDVVETDDGALGLVFNDGTILTVGPTSQVLIDEFIYHPQQGQLSFVARMAKGTATYISGRIGQTNPSAVTFATPVATIGIRGTHFATKVDEEWRYLHESNGNLVRNETGRPYLLAFPERNYKGSTLFVLLPDPDGSVGAITVTSSNGQRADLDEAWEAVSLATATQQMSPITKMAQAEFDRIFGATLAAEPQGPARFLLYFDPGSARPTMGSARQLKQILQAIRDTGSIDVEIYGHTDSTGSAITNMDLSLQRAQQVKEILVRSGVIAPEHIKITYHGEGEPLVPTPDNVQEPRNRRVEVVVR